MLENNPRRNLKAARTAVFLRLQAGDLAERGSAGDVQGRRGVIRVVEHVGSGSADLKRGRFPDAHRLEQRHRDRLSARADDRPDGWSSRPCRYCSRESQRPPRLPSYRCLASAAASWRRAHVRSAGTFEIGEIGPHRVSAGSRDRQVTVRSGTAPRPPPASLPQSRPASGSRLAEQRFPLPKGRSYTKVERNRWRRVNATLP